MTYPATGAAPETIATEVNRTSQGYPSIAVDGIAKEEIGAQIRFLVVDSFPDHPALEPLA